MLVMKDWSWR